MKTWLDKIATELEHLKPANFPKKYREIEMSDEQCKHIAEISDHSYQMIRDFFSTTKESN